MKNISFILILFVLFVSCTEESKLVQEFYSDGKLFKEYLLTPEGKEDEYMKIFYKNEVLESYRTIKNGVFEGEYKLYHDNGTLKELGNHKNGLINGEVKIFDKKGNLEFTVNYLNGEKNGELIRFENKKIKVKKIFISNILVCQIDYDSLGLITSQYRRLLINNVGENNLKFEEVDTLDVNQIVKYQFYLAQYNFYKNEKLTDLNLVYTLTPTLTLIENEIVSNDSIAEIEFDFYKMVDFHKGLVPGMFNLVIYQRVLDDNFIVNGQKKIYITGQLK